MTGGVPPELQPAARSTAPSATRTATGRCTRPCSHTRVAGQGRRATGARRFFDSLRRGVDLYEYQGKELFRRAGIPVSAGRLATTPGEARQAAEVLGGPVVVKAQVLTGGRGKAGGIKLAANAHEAEERAKEILGLDIRGHVVRKLWIESASDIAKEYYLSLTFDRSAKKALYMFTTQGGVDIEQVAEASPDALVQLRIDPLEGFHPWQARRLVYAGGVTDPSEQKQIAAIVGKLHEAFISFDAMLCEINPLIVTPEGEVKALDAKFTVDDNALFRHPEVAEMRDREAADPLEALAREKHVTYVKLDGEVGVLGNGAGLTMSTVDVVTFAGGRPANFCDLGGGGDAQGVVDALSVITRDPQVKAIFFNIFGGITRCDEVARGILQALGEMSLELPIVVRLDGTNAEEGRQILAEAAPPNLRVSPTMLEAAKLAVELAA
jgi:succinyl-CoA synthetase beta subunit